MASSKAVSSLQDKMVCQVCHEVFEGKPFSLKCLHSYCEPCLGKLPQEVTDGKEGISCPVCRQFCKNKDIQHNFMLEEIVQGLKHVYADRILNKPPDDKCGQCKRTDPITATCMTCDRQLCAMCKDTHVEIAVGHEVVSGAISQGTQAITVGTTCADHPGQPIRAHCKPCQKAICGECKLGDHDTHATESVNQALQSLIPQVRSKLQMIQEKADGVKEICGQVNRRTDEIVANHRQALQMAEAEMERRIKLIKDEYKSLQDVIYTQTVVKEGMLVKQDLESSASNLDSVLSWGDTLLDVTQGPGTLYEIQNSLMVRINSLLDSELDDFRDARDFMGRKSGMYSFVPGKYENMLGRFVDSNKAEKSEVEKPNLKPKPNAPSRMETLLAANKNQDKVESSNRTGTVETPSRNNGSGDNFKSFRMSDIQFSSFVTEPPSIKKEIRLKNECKGLCHFNGEFLCGFRNNFDVYDLDFIFVRSVCVGDVRGLNAIHPINSEHLVIAADNGLYIIDGKGTILHKILEKEIIDVNVNQPIIAILLGDQNKAKRNIYLLSSADPYRQTNQFSLERWASKLLVNNESVYISSGGGISRTSSFEGIKRYNFDGKLLSHFGKFGENYVPEEIRRPSLVGIDFTKSVLVLDKMNQILKVVDSVGNWSIVNEIKGWELCDAIIVGRCMYVMYNGRLSSPRLKIYNLC